MPQTSRSHLRRPPPALCEITQSLGPREAKNFLLRLGRKRFGPQDARSAAAVDALDDVQQLEQLGERVLEVQSWQELLQLPAPRRRTPRKKAGS